MRIGTPLNTAFGICLISMACSTRTTATTTPCCGGPVPPHVLEHTKRSQVNLQTPGAWRGKALRAKQSRNGLRGGPEQLNGVLEIPVICFGFKNVNLPGGTVAGLQQELFDGPWPTGTLSDYWREVSYGVFTFGGTVYDVGNLAEDDTYYEGVDNGFTPANIAEYVGDAVTNGDAAIDFGIYDNDGPDGIPNSGDDDGVVDLLALVHPESGGEIGNSNIWSHRWTYSGASGSMLTTNDDSANGGKIRINDYTIMPSLNGGGTLIEMGVFCHEFGHALGFPDLYDTDNTSEGLGHHCLMAAGNWSKPSSPAHPSAWCRIELGWVKPTILVGSHVQFELPAIETTPFVVKLVHDPLGSEYFLLENRQPIGFDQNLEDCGIAIWHIDPGVGNTWNRNEWCTGGALHSYLALEQEDGRCDLENKVNRGDSGDFWSANQGADPIFTSTTTPNTLTYAGGDADVKILNFTDCDNTMRVDITVDSIPSSETRPLDVLFIFDASGSYNDDLVNMLAQLTGVIDDIQDRFPDPRFAVGSFRDFPFGPNGSPSDWAWRIVQDFTDDEYDLFFALGSITADGGNDVPESQYIAIHQAMTGSGVDLDGDGLYGDAGEIPPESLDWDNARAPVIFVMTDAEFHDTDTEDYPAGPPATNIGRTLVINELLAPTVMAETPRVFTLNAAPDGIILTPGQGNTAWSPELLYRQASELGAYSRGSMISAGRNSTEFRVAVREALDLIEAQSPPVGTCCSFSGDCIDGITRTDCELSLGGVFAPGDRVCEIDCDNNGKPDGCEIALGLTPDVNNNLIPDACECLGDSNHDNKVDVIDLLKLLGYWGPCTECPDVDLNGDGKVDVIDLLFVLSVWGDCPGGLKCTASEIEDCFGFCAPQTWLGDGFCDDGAYTYNGTLVYFNCEGLNWDAGDCTPCPPGEIADCNGNCCPEDWIGDGFCDDGTYLHNDVPIFLNCDRFENDGGDCSP
ncbi:MAG: hypothetical protein CMJ24_04280 [Phycisphaerae bacterium]|nr:hypothetical protein [Phycisphaerae bacterium]